MKTIILSEITYTSNNFFNNINFLNFQEPVLAAETLETIGIVGNEDNVDEWMDLILDNSDCLNRKVYAVYSDSSSKIDGNCMFVEVEYTEYLKEQTFNILPE